MASRRVSTGPQRLLKLGLQNRSYSFKKTTAHPRSTSAAFTIVELLIVIVVIAILAAITIVAYSGIQKRASETTLQSDLKNAATSLSAERITSDTDTYPSSDSTLKKSPDTTYAYTTSGSGGSATYCLTAYSTSAKTDKAYYISSTNQTVQEGTCTGHTNPNAGGGSGGSTTITTGSPIQTVTTASCPTERTMVVDTRDNHTYWIQKITGTGGYEKCWMLTNLAYAGGTSNGGANTYNDVIPTGDGTNGTLNGPDNSGSYTYAAAKYYIHANANPTSGTTEPSTDTTGGGSGAARQYGYHYNWCAAMGAQTSTSACANATTPAPDTTISICPAGWRLPTGGSTGEFKALTTAIDATSDTAGSTNLRNSWFAQYGGWWYDGFDEQGRGGLYWSATQYSNYYAYYLYFNSFQVYPSYYGLKFYGQSVRCVSS